MGINKDISEHETERIASLILSFNAHLQIPFPQLTDCKICRPGCEGHIGQ